MSRIAEQRIRAMGELNVCRSKQIGNQSVVAGCALERVQGRISKVTAERAVQITYVM